MIKSYASTVISMESVTNANQDTLLTRSQVPAKLAPKVAMSVPAKPPASCATQLNTSGRSLSEDNALVIRPKAGTKMTRTPMTASA